MNANGSERLVSGLSVYMDNQLVGTQHRTDPLSFTYDPAWLASSEARTLHASLPLSSERIDSAQLHAFFENLLPEGGPAQDHRTAQSCLKRFRTVDGRWRRHRRLHRAAVARASAAAAYLSESDMGAGQRSPAQRRQVVERTRGNRVRRIRHAETKTVNFGRAVQDAVSTPRKRPGASEQVMAKRIQNKIASLVAKMRDRMIP